MICLIKGNDLYIRATKWSHVEDFIWKCSKVNANDWAGNRYFNIEATYTCPTDRADDDISQLSFWKEAHDDICPLNIQGTYIGANHGFNCVEAVTSSSHGKTESDIGSVWLDSSDRTYCLVKVPDENTLRFVMFNDASMSNGKMGYGNPSGTLIHSHGAMHTRDVIIENRQSSQLWQCFNHYSMKLSVDGKECDLQKDGVLYGDKIAIETQYDMIYVPAMLQYLMANAGNHTNESQHSEDIHESYMRHCFRYEFHRNGSVSTYCSFRINKDMELGYIGLVQSMTVADAPYTYVPDTTYDDLTIQDSTMIHNFGKATWHSQEKAPYRYYQFADTSCSKGMALAYDRTIGLGKNEERLKRLEHAGKYYTSRKQYPAFISGGTLQAGEIIEGFAARMPLYQYDDDLTAACWYWVGDDIILMIDAHRAVNKALDLPEYMEGKHIDILDKTHSCTCDQSVITDRKLRFQMDGYGYLVARLY